VRALAAVLVAAAGAARPAQAGPSDVVTRWNVGAWTIWRIERPVAREYAEIRLQPGDRVLLDAGGCGAAASVSIPGATDGAAPVRGLLRRELRLAGSESASLALGRGCAEGGAGWIMIGAHHAAADEPLPLPRPMDLVSNGAVDANGFPLNPQWGVQQTEPGSLPDPVALCFDVPGWFDNPVCTVQRPTLDEPVGVKRAICRIGATTPVSGHVNWFAATYEGPLFWEGKFWSDQDVNVNLVPPDQRGLTVAGPEAIHTEFKAGETLNHFGTPWWKRLRRAANAGAVEKGRALVDGRPGILTGLANLDCEHDCHSELHPVWTFAIQAEASASAETWAVFARNWGNEGFCSSQQHHLETAAHRVTVTVPWREGATGVRLERATTFYASVEGVLAWWTAVPGERVSVTFQLPAPAAQGRVHGELALRWVGEAAAPEARAAVPRPVRERGDGPEPLIEDLVGRLTPRQRRALERHEVTAAALDLVPVVLQPGPPPAAAEAFAPRVRAVADPAGDREDLRRLRGLVDVHGEPLPGSLRELPRLLRERE
jgi:hypothetical protein